MLTSVYAGSSGNNWSTFVSDLGLPAATVSAGILSVNIGRAGEAALSSLGGETDVLIDTPYVRRRIDRLVDGVAIESKVGYKSRTRYITVELMKDQWILNNSERTLVRGYAWVFQESPTTGKGGPSAPLSRSLRTAGIRTFSYGGPGSSGAAALEQFGVNP